MASTYPVEVVQADRWTRANPNLSGDALADALEQQPWDPSVKSLVNTPEVLAMMSDKLDWTVRLGDAFIGQQQQVMDTVQDLRRRAQEAGTLKNTPEQRVQTLVQAEPANSREIIIEQTNPDVVYVPVYDPYVCYGPWWHPNYRPFFWCPPTYPIGWSGIWFGLSYRCGAPWGYAWGRPDWRHHHFTVDVHRHERFNTHIDRPHFQQQIDRRDDHFHVDQGTWVHDAGHRKGVWYRDSNVAQRFGAPTPPKVNHERNPFRDRTATGTEGLMGPRVTTPSLAGRTTNTDRSDDNGIRDRQPDDRVRQSRPPVQAPGLKRDEPAPTGPAPTGRDVRTRDSSGDNRVRQRAAAADDDNRGRQSDRVRIVRPEPTRVPSPDVSRDRGAAFSEVDRDGGSVRMESRRGTISRGPSDSGPSFRSEPAPSRSYSPPPSPGPSRSSGGDDGGNRGGGGGGDGAGAGRSSSAAGGSHGGGAPSRGH
jgi:hypothetical protein